MVHVTAHARERYVERINPRATLDEAEAAIRASAKAIAIAAHIGCRTVIAGRAKLCLDGETVTTVICRHWPTQSSSQSGDRA